MVELNFDATNILPYRPFTFTFANSHTEQRWTERRSMSFDEMASIFTKAEIGPKNGTCYTPAIFSGTSRKMDFATQIDVAVLDSDAGNSLEEIESAIRGHGWAAIVHSTHSHLTCRTIIAAAPYDKWTGENPGATTADYMAAKKSYLPRVIEGAEIIDETHEGAREYVVQHNPCPKFRILIPLATPWLAEDFQSPGAGQAVWRERIGAVAYSIGLLHDQSCVDVSRLFYTPRVRQGAEFIATVIEGEDCPLWTLPGAKAPQVEAPLFNAVAPIHRAFSGHKEVITPDGEIIDLTVWGAQCGSRFEIVKALKARAPGIFGSRRSGSKHHLHCPNAENHTSGANDTTGTYACNASEIGQSGLSSVRGFVLHCSHNGCAGLDRLDHMAALLRSGTLSADDIGNPDFLLPEAPLVDISALLAPKPPAKAYEGNIDPRLYADLPGVMGEIHAYINRTSPKPQPTLNLGATLAFMASAIGQRVKLQSWGTRPNVYILGVAHSGAGKERALSAIKQMAKSAGLFEELIGVEEVASDSGIISSVIQQPRQIMLLDEVAHLIASVNNKGASTHIANVVSTLLKLYSASGTMYKGRSYADLEKVKSVDQPCASLYGCCTPTGLYKALSSNDIESGLLSRAVLFDAGDHDPYASPPSQEPVPAIITDWLRAWKDVNPIQNHVAMEGGLPVMEPRIVVLTREAADLIQAFAREMQDAKTEALSSGTNAVYVRVNENTLKFALIRACASPAIMIDGKPKIDESTLIVDAEAVAWAIAVNRCTVQRMEVVAREEIADTDFEQKMRALREAMRKAGPEGMTMRTLGKHRAGRMSQRNLDDLLARLASNGDIQQASVSSGKRGRPKIVYVHSDYIAEESEDE